MADKYKNIDKFNKKIALDVPEEVIKRISKEKDFKPSAWMANKSMIDHLAMELFSDTIQQSDSLQDAYSIAYKCFQIAGEFMDARDAFINEKE